MRLVRHNLFTAVVFFLQNQQGKRLLIFIAKTLPETNIEKTQKMYTILDKPPWWNQTILFTADPFVHNPTKLFGFTGGWTSEKITDLNLESAVGSQKSAQALGSVTK